MDQFEEVEHSHFGAELTGAGIDDFVLANQRNAGCPAAGIELEFDRLDFAAGNATVDETDDERQQPMHTRTTTGEQQPRTLLAARHQRLAASIQNEYHVDPFASTATGGRPARLPHGTSQRVALTGLVTGALRHRSPRQCCTAASRLSTLAVARFVAPEPCLLPPLAEQRTEEAFAGASRTSVQRSRGVLRLSLDNQDLLAAFAFTSPHYSARALSGGLLTRVIH